MAAARRVSHLPREALASIAQAGWSHGLHRYYVDASNGSDLNDGRLPSRAWKTIGRVNRHAGFRLGDRVLFRRGCTWTGETLAARSGMTYDAFGAGEAPVIDGADAVDCATVGGATNVKIANLRLVNGRDFGALVNGGAQGIRLANLTIEGSGNDNLSIIGGCRDVIVTNLVSKDAYRREAGPTITCVEVADGCQGVLIDGLEASGSAGMGVSVHAHPGERLPHGVIIRNGRIRTAGEHGVQVSLDNGSALAEAPEIRLQNLVIEECVKKGVNLTRVNGGQVYPAGVRLEGCTVRNNVSGGAGFYQVELRGTDHRMKRCVVAARAERGVLLEACAGVEVTHNTVWVPAGTGFIGVCVFTGMVGARVRNNIFATGSTGVPCVQVLAGAGPGLEMDGNLYYTPSGAGANRWSWAGAALTSFAGWKTQSGQEAHAPEPADPLFVDAANGDFGLLAGSPAVDGGVDVGWPYSGEGPDCGALENE